MTHYFLQIVTTHVLIWSSNTIEDEVNGHFKLSINDHIKQVTNDHTV